MNDNLLSITRNNHGAILTHNFDNFFKKESYCDATLICERKHIKVHKIVLSACSEYFRELFDDAAACLHPYIILKDVALTELEALLEYMYNGKTSIFKTQFSHFLNTADYFRIKGLSVSDSEFHSSVKISVVNSNILSSSCSTPVCDKSESLSIPIAKKNIDEDKFSKEINNTSSVKINTNRGNESINVKNASVSNVNKVQKNEDHGTFHSSEKEKQCTLLPCPEKENNLVMEPLILLNRNEHLKKNKKSNPVLGDSMISKKMKVDKNGSSLLSERVKNDNHRMSRSDKKSSKNDVPSHLSERVMSDSHRVSRSRINSSKEDTTKKTVDSEVPPNFDLSHELSLNNHQNQRFGHNCFTCGFSAKYRTQLVAHMKTHDVHTTNISKRYRCTICTFSTRMEGHLERHIKGHKKPLKCKNCNFRASLNISMKKHEDACLKGSVSAKHLDIDNVSGKDNISAKKSQQKKLCLKGGENTEQLNVVCTAPTEDDDELPDISTPVKLPDISTPVKLPDISTPVNKPFGKDYFQCAFCSHKTSSETLLTSHVKSTHIS